MKFLWVFTFAITLFQTAALPNRRGTLRCLKCLKQDDLTVAECVENGVFETCGTKRPTCMTELWNKRGKIVFSSGCHNRQACVDVEAKELGMNQCDKQPLIINTKCRYYCTIQDELAPGGYCRFPAWKTCVVKGDPHFTTLDGYKYDFSGSCGYTLLQDISNGPGVTPTYMVSATDMYIGQTARVVDVNITVEGHAIEIDCEIGEDESSVEIRIDGISPIINSFPFEFNEGRLIIDNDEGGYMVVSAPLAGLIVFWNKKYHLEIMFDTTMIMEGKLSIGGMCGNGNGNADFQDELITRGSIPVENGSPESIEDFAASWEVTGTCVSM
uniref:Zonadhesin-like n=1 Tax=Saccoglossus kowalevskii TaxID=10224 RepID=A0ABM0MGA1_SACKO|nr:PREDICTED: zonadhesin-like [Saccoglossus kowalevskii]